ncbi:MAG: DUF3261 domain-containing protein [Proteobacteria bacterium]|nr:DUF3261 domain-containing protein [Pseudomonadota bacterium]
MTRICTIIVMTSVVAACSGVQRPKDFAKQEPGAVKMRHQILFAQGDEEHVFEGYLVLANDAILVKAFAGPGIDLFTVVRDNVNHFEQLHIPSLADKIDIEAVAADIARVYLGGCHEPTDQVEVSCDFFGEKMTERYDEKGRLEERRFPDAHGVGLRIRYEEYEIHLGRAEPKRITLSWGTSKNRMVILLIAFELLDHIDPKIFQDAY